MASVDLEVIIDGDGHILEDAEGISKFLPSVYQHRAPLSMGNGHLSLFPPLDHLHSGHFVEMRGIVDRGHVGPEEWFDFMKDVGIDETVLYPSTALAYGKIVSRDWAIAVTRAYNDWLYETYVKRSPRFHGMALIPMQEPEAAVEELRRAVEDQGMKGAIPPSMGLAHNLGDKEYWPVYQEADRLGCCMAIHGGCHEGLGFDNMNVYAPVHAMGHPIGIMIGLAGMVFNGIFDRYPNMKVAFLEGGVAWFLMAIERFESSHDAHNEYQVRDELLGPKRGERVSEYLIKHIKEGSSSV